MSRIRDYRRMVAGEVKVLQKFVDRVNALKAQPPSPKRDRRIARLSDEGVRQMNYVKKLTGQ